MSSYDQYYDGKSSTAGHFFVQVDAAGKFVKHGYVCYVHAKETMLVRLGNTQTKQLVRIPDQDLANWYFFETRKDQESFMRKNDLV